MTGRALAAGTAGVLVALGLVLWCFAPRQSRVVAPDQPLPFDEKVQLRFGDGQSGESEIWKLEKRETTREESLQAVALPEPDPVAAAHAPDDSARALDAQALEVWKHGQLEQAMQLFEQAIAADPDDRVPRSHYGRLLTLMTDYERARPQLERAAELAPEDPQVWLDLQSLYERIQRLDQAFAARERAEALAGGRAISQTEMGLYQIDGEAAFP